MLATPAPVQKFPPISDLSAMQMPRGSVSPKKGRSGVKIQQMPNPQLLSMNESNLNHDPFFTEQNLINASPTKAKNQVQQKNCLLA